MQLTQWGWNACWTANFLKVSGQSSDLVEPARVSTQYNHIYEVQTESGAKTAEVAGHLKYAAATGRDLPAVGDWVAVRRTASESLNQGGRTTIVAVLPRRSVFSRATPGRQMAEQIVAANIDTVFLISALDHDFNPRRIERYLTMAWESGARPVVLLNKVDQCSDLPKRLTLLGDVCMAVPIYPISARTGDGVNELIKELKEGTTSAFVGSSGVGKSTLINRLMGSECLATQPVRLSDSRGRHTTTRRELICLPGGALVVDTPGMRELQLWNADNGLSETFEDIRVMAHHCRFKDCQHQAEPDCAVLGAVQKGIISEDRLAGWHKLMREIAHQDRRHDKQSELENKRRWKAVHKAQRDFYKEHGK